MNRFQPIDFQDLDDLFAFLPDDELEIVQALRSLVYDCIPEIKEKLSYNVPYFKVRKKHLLYLARVGALGRNIRGSPIWFRAWLPAEQ